MLTTMTVTGYSHVANGKHSGDRSGLCCTAGVDPHHTTPAELVELVDSTHYVWGQIEALLGWPQSRAEFCSRLDALAGEDGPDVAWCPMARANARRHLNWIAGYEVGEVGELPEPERLRARIEQVNAILCAVEDCIGLRAVDDEPAYWQAVEYFVRWPDDDPLHELHAGEVWPPPAPSAFRARGELSLRRAGRPSRPRCVSPVRLEV